MNATENTRKYLTVDQIQKEYLPLSKKRIRTLVKLYLPIKTIGGRIFVDRQQLEDLLSDVDREYLPLG